MLPILSAPPLGQCPDRDLLLQFDQGRLSTPELSWIEQHISSCDRCVETLHTLQEASGDPVLDCLKEYFQQHPIPFGAGYAGLAATASMGSVGDEVPRDPAQGKRPAGAGSGMIGRRIGRYEVLGRIGRGGMGVVYLARQHPLEREVALKMILAGHHASASMVARFLREGKAVARLGHPNVVQVHDLGEHEGLPYLSMEYVDGGSLDAKLGEGPLEPRAAAVLVATLATAVEFAHQHGVVHRDLKPGNVLLTQTGIPKITDFGLAKLLDPGSDGDPPVSLTDADTILGTANYMAPEQAEGRLGDIGRRTDVYALGAILYSALTGQPPFVDESKLKVLERVRKADPTPPSRLREDVPHDLEAICLTCLEKSPARRYCSAQALADDLERWLRDERPQGTPSGLTRLSRTVGKKRPHLACAGIILSVVAGFSLHEPDREAERIQSELARGRPVSLIGETGKPRWFRWESGKSGTQAEVGDDRAWTVSSWSRALLELVPDPQVDSYRFTAQVRHEESHSSGEAGLYFGHNRYQFDAGELQFFNYYTFNAIWSNNDRLKLLPDGVKKPSATSLANVPSLRSYLFFEPSAGDAVNHRLGLASGPRFKPGGSNRSRWHDLEIVVTPASVTCSWDDGPPFSIASTRIENKNDEYLKTLPPSRSIPLPAGFSPKFDVRGGIGLYVSRGSVAFRSVKLAPLKPSRVVPPASTTGDHRREGIDSLAARKF